MMRTGALVTLAQRRTCKKGSIRTNDRRRSICGGARAREGWARADSAAAMDQHYLWLGHADEGVLHRGVHGVRGPHPSDAAADVTSFARVGVCLPGRLAPAVACCVANTCVCERVCVTVSVCVQFRCVLRGAGSCGCDFASLSLLSFSPPSACTVRDCVLYVRCRSSRPPPPSPARLRPLRDGVLWRRGSGRQDHRSAGRAGGADAEENGNGNQHAAGVGGAAPPLAGPCVDSDAPTRHFGRSLSWHCSARHVLSMCRLRAC